MPLPLLNKPDFPVAHTPRKGDLEYRWHSYEDHVRGVEQWAVRFAAAFGGEAWARYAARIHDIGKLDSRFQDYLWECHLADRTGETPPRAGSAPHKQAGALIAYEALRQLRRERGFSPLVQGLFGHHGGMLDPTDSAREMWARDAKASDKFGAVWAKARALHSDFAPALSQKDLLALLQSPKWGSESAREMFFRFIFSCLTDADALDTESHLNPDDAERRRTAVARMPSLCVLRDHLIGDQAALQAKAEADAAGATDEGAKRVHRVRREVYEDCRAKAKELSPGRVVTLTVPTGGGKTRSSLAFALEHAVAHGLSRVIYAIPFTSIVDQTAGVFEKIWAGIDGAAVLEHHSAIEPPESHDDKKREDWRRLAAQNWDSAPVIVTTTVQLFESLLGNRPGKCRKLHRFANAVIVLDEVQTLPPDLLQPLVTALRLLAEQYGTTVVLCTATQPALDSENALNPVFKGFDPKPEEINRHVEEHFTALKRVTYRLAGIGPDSEGWDWARVAAEMRGGSGGENGSALCIVNTRRQALDLLRALDPDGSDPSVFHLSTLMCGKHRRRVLAEVRQRLAENKPVLLASTQLVESGIDLNFSTVLRALGPLPSIIQAAGRCNREGKRSADESEVLVFRPAEDSLPPDLYKLAREHTERELARLVRKGRDANAELDKPAFVTGWFASYFAELGLHVDRYDIERDRAAFRYQTVAQNARLIRTETVPVLVTTYEPGEVQAILEAAQRYGRMTDALWWRAQPYMVNLYERDAAKLDPFVIEEKEIGFHLWQAPYDTRIGVGAVLEDPAIGVVRPPDDLMP